MKKDDILKAMEELESFYSNTEANIKPAERIVKDQNGVVWFLGGTLAILSRESYETLCEDIDGAPKYEDLELWDSHDQNVVDVD